MFVGGGGAYSNQPVCPSVCEQNTSFCQSAAEGIKSHLVTAIALSHLCYRSRGAYVAYPDSCFHNPWRSRWDCKKDAVWSLIYIVSISETLCNLEIDFVMG